MQRPNWDAVWHSHTKVIQSHWQAHPHLRSQKCPVRLASATSVTSATLVPPLAPHERFGLWIYEPSTGLTSIAISKDVVCLQEQHWVPWDFIKNIYILYILQIPYANITNIEIGSEKQQHEKQGHYVQGKWYKHLIQQDTQANHALQFDRKDSELFNHLQMQFRSNNSHVTYIHLSSSFSENQVQSRKFCPNSIPPFFLGDCRVSPLYIHARIGRCVFLARLMRVIAKDERHPQNQKSKADFSTWPIQPIWNLSRPQYNIFKTLNLHT